MWDLGDTQQQSSWQCDQDECLVQCAMARGPHDPIRIPCMAMGPHDPIRIPCMATAQEGRCLVQHNYRKASSALVVVQEGKF